MATEIVNRDGAGASPSTLLSHPRNVGVESTCYFFNRKQIGRIELNGRDNCGNCDCRFNLYHRLYFTVPSRAEGTSFGITSSSFV